MTRKQIMSMRRKARIGAIIGSVIFLVAGISTIGKAGGSEVTKSQAMAEAGNQDTEGKTLVMRVVLSRVGGDNEFPNTIREVIYQPRQFSPVLEGKFEDAEPNEDCWKALALIESGWDESYGALYFESKSDSTWHEINLRFLFKHQDHYFYTEKEQADEED